jgi:flagellar biosynthesis protein FliR
VIEGYIARAVLIGIRIGALMTFAPFFGNASLPAPVKAGLTFMLTVLLLPLYVAGPAPPDLLAGGIFHWLALAVGEIAIGMMAGFVTQFVFDGMILAGQIVGFQFGFSLANVIDPNSQVEITVISTLHELVALLIFMELGVHRWLLRATAASFRMIPVGTFASGMVPAQDFLRISGAMWLIGAEIAFPVVLTTMLLDLTIGFLAKAAPQFPALFFGIAAKVLLGLAVMYGAVAFWPSQLGHYFYRALENLEHLLSAVH